MTSEMKKALENSGLEGQTDRLETPLKKRGRPSLFGRPLTNAERIKRCRERRRERLPWENREATDELHRFFGEPHLQERNL